MKSSGNVKNNEPAKAVGGIVPRRAIDSSIYSLLDKDKRETEHNNHDALKLGLFKNWQREFLSGGGGGGGGVSSSTSSGNIGPDGSVLSREDSRSDVVSLVPSEESRVAFLRHSVEQDSRLGYNSPAGDEEDGSDEGQHGEDNDDNSDEEVSALAQNEQASLTGTALTAATTPAIASATVAAVPTPVSAPPKRPRQQPQKRTRKELFQGKLKFLFMVRGDPTKKRSESQVMELADEYNLDTHPRRVLIATHVARYFNKNRPPPVDKSGKPLSPYTYQFFIYSSIGHVLKDLMNLPAASRTLFAVVEENGPVFMYLDLELPLAWRKAERHGNSMRNFFGYCIALVRAIMSLLLGINMCCISDSYILFESQDATKWSAHVHIGWPFRSIASLRSMFALVRERLWEMFESGVEAVRPVFYYFENPKTQTSEWKCAIDLGVYTKKRNFRLPECTKCDKNAFLRNTNFALPRWNRIGESPCAVNLANPAHVLSTGLILARNSIGFWNPITVRFAPLLEHANKQLDMSSSDSSCPVPQPNDFRCLPDSGVTKTRMDRLRALCNGNIPNAFHERMSEFLQSCYEENWMALVRPFCTGEPNDDIVGGNISVPADDATNATAATFGRVLQSAHAFCSQSPLNMTTFLLVWAHLYRPGLGIDQKIAHTEHFAVRLIVFFATKISTAVTNRNHSAACTSVFALLTMTETHLSATCTTEMQAKKKEFLVSLQNDFIKNFLVRSVLNNTYNADQLLDVFVLFSLIPSVVLCSGFHVLSMQRDEPAAAAAAATTATVVEQGWILPSTLTEYSAETRFSSYERCFKAVLRREGKQQATRVSCINTVRIKEDETAVISLYNHRKHQYRYDPVDVIIPQLRKRLRLEDRATVSSALKASRSASPKVNEEEEQSSSEEDDGNDCFRIVRVQFRIPEQE